MNCEYCHNPIPDGAKFCGKCGKSVDENREAILVKKKAIGGVRIIMGIIVALIVFGILAKAIVVIVSITAVLLGVSSTEGLRNADSVANILGFIGGAYLADLVYISIAGKDKSPDQKKKKWYQFAGFMSRGNKTKARPILVAVIIGITVIALALWVGFGSSNVTPQNASDSGQSNSSSNSWIVYNAPESNFSVELPSSPTHDTSNQNTANGEVKIDSYKTADNTASVAYIVNVTAFPQSIDMSNSSGTLENTVNLSAKNGEIIFANLTTHGGYPAIDYLIQFNDTTTTNQIRGLNILVGQRLYQLLTAYDIQQESKLEFNNFADSFQVN